MSLPARWQAFKMHEVGKVGQSTHENQWNEYHQYWCCDKIVIKKIYLNQIVIIRPGSKVEKETNGHCQVGKLQADTITITLQHRCLLAVGNNDSYALHIATASNRHPCHLVLLKFGAIARHFTTTIRRDVSVLCRRQKVKSVITQHQAAAPIQKTTLKVGARAWIITRHV